LFKTEKSAPVSKFGLELFSLDSASALRKDYPASCND
jgi:hypothetical protein